MNIKNSTQLDYNFKVYTLSLSFNINLQLLLIHNQHASHIVHILDGGIAPLLLHHNYYYYSASET